MGVGKDKFAVDRKLRFLLLQTLHLSRGKSPSGGLTGPTLLNWTQSGMGDEGVAFDDDEHAVQMIRDLIDRGYVTAEIKPRRQGEAFRVKHFALVKITSRGSDLVDWTIDADPKIDDGRERD